MKRRFRNPETLNRIGESRWRCNLKIVEHVRFFLSFHQPNRYDERHEDNASLVVEEIERSLPFWVERLGFEEIVRVPDGERIGFIMLQHQGVKLMMQTAASVSKDVPKFAPREGTPVTSLFVEVESLEEIEAQLQGYPIAMPERTTFYGMREIGVLEPGGNIVVFACKS